MENVSPLSGIKVIDVTRALAGPFCTMLLGDQGAEVIKIEQPGLGDDTRRQSNPKIGDENTAFLAANRNKKSITVNLRKTEGQKLVRKLIADADVFVENFRPGKADELGLGYEQLKKENPRLIYCSISGWGQDGPYADRGGFATTAEAAGGLMSVTGSKGGEPVKVGVSIIDNLAGLFAKDAITAALYAREKTGRGQRIETSLLESTVAILCMAATAYLHAGEVAERLGSEHAYNVPWKVFKTSDGYVVVAGGSEGQWKKICTVIGKPEWATDERFCNMERRNEHRDELYALLGEVLVQKSNAEWLELAGVHQAAFAPVNTIDQVFKDPQVLHRQMVQYVDHQTLGRIAQVGHAQKLSENPLTMRLAPPTLGQHTEEILHSLGLTEEMIESLRSQKVI